MLFYKYTTVSLIVFLLLFIFFSVFQMKKIETLSQTITNQQKEITYQKNLFQKTLSENQTLQKQINEKQKLIKDLSNKLEILVTFRDAGLAGQDVSDIRNLLELADNIPYGSPFKSGHIYTSLYGKRDEAVFGGSPNGHHKGVDLVPKQIDDTMVRATANGEIVDFGYSEVLGKYIIFETSSGYRLKYAHLKTILWQNVEKQTVKNVPITKGDKLGIMGNTGTWSTGAHLHLEIHVLNPKTQVYQELNPWRIIEYIGGYDE